MRRKLKQSAKLPALKCDIAQLEALTNELLGLFEGKGSELYLSLTIELPGESLEFSDFEELRTHGNLPATVTNFQLWISDRLGIHRHCWLYKSGLFDSGTADAESDSHVWNASAIAIIKDFAARSRRWYSPLKRWMAWGAFMLLSWLPAIPGANVSTGPGLVAWALSVILVGYVTLFGWNRVFPNMSLVIREEESWLRRYQSEITTTAAIASAIGALIAAYLASRR